jgi:integrase
MKAGKEHKVRLSSQALDLLRSLDRVVGNDCLFPGQEPGASVGETALRDKLNKGKAKGGLGYSAEHATVHGFRSTFRDWAGDNLVGFTDQDIEFCLAHVVGDAAEAAYRRADSFVKRGLIMQAWADYATGVKKAATLQLVEAA